MALVSPGVQVTVIDESQYLPAPPASVPLIVLATAQNKTDASGVTIAPGTLAVNANKLYAVTSQRDLVTFFGTPLFYKTTDGTPIQGYELNEYGLLTAYSVLGQSNLCYVIRSDINLAALKGSVGRPSAAPADGSYWMNTTLSTYGMFQFSQSTGVFAVQNPIVIENATQVTGATGQPLQSIGNIGAYAVSLTSQYGAPSSYGTYWFKNYQNTWVIVGSPEWQASWPTVQGTATPVSISAGSIIINGTTVAVPATNTVAGLVGAINAANIPFVTAEVTDGRLELFISVGTTMTISGTAGVLSDLGVSAGTYYAPALVYGTNAQQPLWRSTDAQPHPTGSMWIKTNTPNLGTSIVVSRYNAVTATYATKNVQLSTSDWVINNILDATGGAAIPATTVYAQYDFNSQAITAPLQLFVRAAAGASTFVGTTTTPVFANNATFNVYVSQPNSSSLSGPYTVTMPATGTLGGTAFVTAWAAAAIPDTVATVAVTGAITLTHTYGGVIILDDQGVTSPASAVAAAGFTINTNATTPDGCIGAKWGPYQTISYTALATSGGTGTGLTLNATTTGYTPTFTVNAPGTGYVVGDLITVTGGGALSTPYTAQVSAIGGGGTVTGIIWYANTATPQYSVQLSAWEIFNYTPNLIAPVGAPTNDTPWFYSVVDQVDIMTNVAGAWKGYLNVSYNSSGLPQATGVPATDPKGPIVRASAPTTQSDNSPLVYGDLWIDVSDLENYPVINRWQNFNGQDQWVLINNTNRTTETGIVFADARWAPNGTTDPIDDPIPTIVSLLTSNYLDLDAPNAELYPQGTLLFNTRRSGYNVKEYMVNYFNGTTFPDQTLPTETDAWVTASGLQTNGAPYMGGQAQRAMIVKALKTTIDTNTQIRDEDTFFNLLACPNYCETQPNMVTLNNDRNQTCYIVGDTPMTLQPNGQAISNWAKNTAGATATSIQGLVTRDTYLGLYYPSGIASDLTGMQVAVPPSHMILSTMIYNDKVAYPWFAPAGQRRGIITNATNIGYINAKTGLFVVDKNNLGLRDVEYTNFINPITQFQNIGLLNYGNKNSFDSQSALDRTNVARLINYLRTRLAIAVRPFLFEPNDASTRSQVRAICATLLADVQSKRGVYDYLVVCDTSNNTPERIDRNELWIDIAIEPTKAVEFIYIPIRILNTGAIAALATNG
jgi:hypothetical protein